MSGRNNSKKNFSHSTGGSRNNNNSYVYHPGVVHMTPSQLFKIVTLDHCYALPSAPQEKKTPTFPVRFLFQSADEIQALNEPKSKLENLLQKKPSKRASQRPKSNDEEEIDVSVTDLPPRVPYDPPKAKNLMAECEKNVNFARMTEAPDNWEENIVKIGWTKPQKRLFNKIIQVLHDEHLARLAYADSSPEPLLRRLSMDKTAQKFRSILTQFSWDTKLIQWLHGVLVDNLSLDYLAEYLDILQTLKTNIPTLIDRMITLSTSASTSEMVNAEALNLLLKRPWDPFATSVHHSKIKKPPPSIFPIFVVVPSGPPGSSLCPQRQKSFLSMLSAIGKIVTVNPPAELNISVEEYTEKMLSCTKAKVAEIITGLCDKPLYLMGWGNGSVIAALVSLEMNVSGVICLGFPMYALTGTRLDVEDPLHGLRQPTLFVVGDRATNNCVTDMEIFRKELSCVNALSVVCHADSLLRVTNYHQKRLLVTQSYIDKCIVEEISWFLTNIPILEEELKVQAREEEEQALNFDGPRAVPANSSASKRKSYHRPANKDTTSSPNYATASKLIHPPPAKRKQSLPPAPIAVPSSRTPAVLSTAKSSSVSKIPSAAPVTASPMPSPSPVPHTNTIPSPSLSPILKASLGHPVAEQSKSQQPTVIPAKTSFVVKTKTFQSVSNEPATPAYSPKFLAGKPAPLPTIPDKRAGSIEQWKSAGAGSSIGHALSSNAGASLNSALKQHPPTKPSHLSSSSAAEDSQILRRLITSSAASSVVNAGGVITSASTGFTLPQDTTATLSSHPIKSVPKLPEHASGRADQAQRLQFITSLLPNQQSEPGKSTILSLQHPNMSPQIIRITPINVPASPVVTTATSSNSIPPQERPLPTRCTDESLAGLDPSEGLSQKGQINPELFQHLKSTLSVSKDKSRPQSQVVTKTVQQFAMPVTAEQLKSMTFVSTEKKDGVGSNEGEPKLVAVSLASCHGSSAATVATTESSTAEIENSAKNSFKPPVSGGFASHVQVGSDLPGPMIASKTLSSCNVIVVDKLATEAQSTKVLGGIAVPQDCTSQPSLQTLTQCVKVIDETQSGQKDVEVVSAAESGTKLLKEEEVNGQRLLDTAAAEIKSSSGVKNATESAGKVLSTVDKANLESCPKPSVLLERINLVRDVNQSLTKDHAGTSKSMERNEDSVLPKDDSSRNVVTVEPSDKQSSLGSTAADSKSSALEDEEHPTLIEKAEQLEKSIKESKVDGESTSATPKHSKKSHGTGDNNCKYEEEVSARPNSRAGRFHAERREDPKDVIEKTPVKRKHDDNTRRRTRATSRGESDDGNKSDKGNEEPRKKKKTRSSSSSSSRRSAQNSPETIDVLSSDDELTPRMTRSKARTTPQSGGEIKRTNKEDADDEEATEGNDDNDSQDGDEDGTGEQRKKHLKPIHPVTPASLSATRTRKISIPKFYAFGM